MSVEVEAAMLSNRAESIIGFLLQLRLFDNKFGLEFAEISRQGGPISLISSLLIRKRGVAGRML